MAEFWDAYDRFRRKTGEILIRGEKLPEGTRHLVVHMIYYNDKGEILIQKRSASKDLAPGVWAFTGGSALAGEDSIAACIRETSEEMGFIPDMSEAECIMSYSRRDTFTDIYLIKANIEICDLKLQPEEVDDAKWINRTDMLALAEDKNRFWDYSYIKTVLKYLTEVGYLR